MRITVLGLPRVAFEDDELATFARARLLVGARRHLETVAHLVPPAARRQEFTADLGQVLDAIATADGEVVVLASGDPGFFGIVRALAERFGPGALRVRPAPSSVARAFAAAGLPWDDALVVSAHGRDPAFAVNACRRWPKVAVLTAPDFGPADLATALAGLQRRLVIAEDLGGPAERVVEAEPAEAAAQHWRDPNVVVVLDPGRALGPKGRSAPPRLTPTAWALPEDAFAHRDGMVTKAEVRALALAWLGPGLGDLVWDVGAGSGAVAVEAARLGAAVIAVEADPEQSARVRVNAQRHDVPVTVVEGRAPGILADLPDPDAAFVGGGGTAVAGAVAERVRRAVVVALATLERVGPVSRALADEGLEVSGTMLAASRLAPLGGGQRLAAKNPVFVLAGRRP